MKSYVRDDIDFLDHLPTKVDFDSTFISLDVTSLYTNITHDSGIEAIAYWIENYPTYLIDTCFTKEFIIEGLRLVLKNNYFKFDNKIFHQLIGTTMGSNESVIYAILFMAYLELQLYSNVRDIYILVIMQSTLSAHGRDILTIVLSSGTTDMSFNLFI